MVQEVAIMRRIHPRLAGAIFIFLYNLIGGLVYFILHFNLYKYKIYYVIGLIGGLIIVSIIGHKYYGEILKETTEEENFLNKAIENRKKLEEE